MYLIEANIASAILKGLKLEDVAGDGKEILNQKSTQG